MLNKEAIVQQGSCDLVTITETWWDDSHDWSAAVDGGKLFRRDRKGRRGGAVALCGRECFDWGQSYLISLSEVWMRRLSAPSVSLQMTPNWVGLLIC